MVDFTLVQGCYDRVVPYLKKVCPGFDGSPEHRLVADHEDLPGVVLSAFGSFVKRLFADGSRVEAAMACEAINAMDDWNDTMTSVAIRENFLEALSDTEHAGAIQALLKPQLAKALEAWVSPNPALNGQG